jgi:hypothetical protein
MPLDRLGDGELSARGDADVAVESAKALHRMRRRRKAEQSPDPGLDNLVQVLSLQQV